MSQGKIIILRSSDGQYYFILTVLTRGILLTSNLHRSRGSVRDAIFATVDNATNDARFFRHATGAQFYFTLRAANGQILATSERYGTPSARDAAMAAVKRVAPSAEIDERAEDEEDFFVPEETLAS